MSSARKSTNPALQAKIKQMSLKLQPLLRVTTGTSHPAFPSTLLNFWLLTSDELDELASFYHQHTPSHWSSHYPCPVVWGKNLTLEEKRRKIGRFIGLRGCETPVKSEEEIREEMKQQQRKEEEDIWRRKLRWYN
ncbi:hypothetical protein B0O99DRAFT_14723 [Bisporella sp. PMI_857]|nr:hypothetical protein B0O99DRAFT_14723 [Bisporella sp. PMI_857]